MISSLLFAQSFIISCSTSINPIYSEVTSVYFYRKYDKVKSNNNNKHAPSVPLTTLHAEITPNSEIILFFEDEDFSDIDVTVAYGDIVIYYNHYTRKGCPTISIPFTMLGNELPYSISINNKGKMYEAHFSL